MRQRNEEAIVHSLAGKTVVITGASSGIGRAAALEFARRKANVVLTARREQALRELADECAQFGARTHVAPADITDENAVKGVAQKALEAFGRIDVWVNNAGVTLYGRFEEIPADAYRRVIETNLFGYINGARAAIPHFLEKGQGVLINVSSVLGEVAQPFTSAYNVSKGAINSFSESLRMELADSPDIHVCTVLAAAVDTPLYQHAANYTGRAVKPLAPVYGAEKVAQAIAGLAVHPRREVVVGASGRMAMAVDALLPGAAEKMMARRAEREGFQDRAAAVSSGNLFSPVSQWTSISGGWTDTVRKNRAARRVAFGLGVLALWFGIFGLIRARSR